MKLNHVVLFVLIFCAVIYSSYGAVSLASGKATYAQSLKSLDGKLETGKQAALDQYLKNLQNAEVALKKRGDLDNLLAVKAETKRFIVSRNIDDVGTESPVIEAVQSYYNGTLEKLEEEKRLSTISLTKKWYSYLGQLQKKLTREGNVSDALKARSEAEKVKQEIAALEANLDPGTKMVKSDCPKCGGSGEESVDCTYCGGSGKCKFCKGLGRKPGLNAALNCSACAGTGSCHKCNGTSQQKSTCSKCRGKRQIMVAAQSNPKNAPAGVTMAKFNKTSPTHAASRSSSIAATSAGMAGLQEYIENMTKLYSDYKAGQSSPERLSTVISDSNRVGKLYTSVVYIMSAFPRSVVVAVKTDGQTMGVDMAPHSQKVGKQATGIFDKGGAGTKVQVTYGFANDEKVVLFDAKAM